MSAEYDATEFVDNDFQAAHQAAFAGPGQAAFAGPGQAAGAAGRAPTREEVDSRMSEAQQKLAELKRVQEELERERAGLEETRRRQIEFQTGREEAIRNLTRGVGLLTAAEFASRRDAAQMAKSLADLQAALEKVQSTSEAGWTKDNFSVELTRALTVIENARMEWNAARLKFPMLSGETPAEGAISPQGGNAVPEWLARQSLGQLCKLGFAVTWPLAAVALLVGLLLVFLLRR